jgi:hypothetical protein
VVSHGVVVKTISPQEYRAASRLIDELKPHEDQAMSIDNGGRAFPRSGGNGFEGQTGMSLRTWLAGKAFPAIYARFLHDSEAETAIKCLRYADALIAELAKGQETPMPAVEEVPDVPAPASPPVECSGCGKVGQWGIAEMCGDCLPF